MLPANFQPRFDSAESVFVERSLLWIETEAYELDMPPLEGRMYVPTDNSDPPGTKFTAYRQYTRIGAARLMTSRGQDIPNVGLFVKEFQHQYYPLAAGYEYDYLDLLAAAVAAENGGPPINLDLDGAQSAREAIERKLDLISATGTASSTWKLEDEVDVGLVGLLNHPNGTLYTVATGFLGTTVWSDKTPDEVLADLTGIVAAQINGTYKVYKPGTILLPVLQFEQIGGRSMGDGRSDTILSYFARTNKHVKEVDSWAYLAGAGVGTTDRMVAYTKEKRLVRHKVCMEFTQLPTQLTGMTYRTPCLAKSAGIVCPKPLSLSYGDGI